MLALITRYLTAFPKKIYEKFTNWKCKIFLEEQQKKPDCLVIPAATNDLPKGVSSRNNILKKLLKRLNLSAQVLK